MYDFEHDCEVANCQEATWDAVVQIETSETVGSFLLRVLGVHTMGLVSVYSSIGLWVGVWNNLTTTGVGKHFCNVEVTDFCELEDMQVELQIFWIFFGISLQFSCASLLENGQVYSKNDPVLSRFEHFWASIDESFWVAHVFRGLVAYIAQIMTTCGMYSVLLILYSLDRPSMAKDIAALITGLVGFAFIIVAFEYYQVGKSIERLDENDTVGTTLGAEDILHGEFNPVDAMGEYIVHFGTLMHPVGITVEPLEQPIDISELQEDMEALLPRNEDSRRTIGNRFERFMSALRSRRRFNKYRYVMMALCSHWLQSCAWLGMDRLCQEWIISPNGMDFVTEVTISLELKYMGTGLFLMLFTGTFMVHTCMDSTRNVAAKPCSVIGDFDLTVRGGLFYSFILELLGLFGNYMNITGAWFLLDEHLGLPQSTMRNNLFLFFLIPLTFSGTFYNEAGIGLEKPELYGTKSIVQSMLETMTI